jgi:hypothetical protein
MLLFFLRNFNFAHSQKFKNYFPLKIISLH